MVNSVDEIETLENEDINKEPESGKAKASLTPGNPAAQAGVPFGGHFSTIFGGGPSFVPPVGTPVRGLSQSLPTCLIPEPSNRLGDFEDYLGQFKTAAFLSG